ncbi:MAG: phosphatidylglycerol lysyltransferase domain-containing protein [bacterium]
MIPVFPNFKKLELSDKKEVEKFTSEFPPYSDFNFISMWIWDIADNMMISQLNKNLVVVFNDYLSGKPFISFIGKNKISETTLDLIKFSENKYKTSSLKLITEENANILGKIGFTVTPDNNSHDYVYLISHLANMNTWSQNTSGKGIRRFIKKYPSYVVKQFNLNEIQKEEYIEMFKKWANNKKIINHFEMNEYKAFKRLLQINDKNIKIISLYEKDVLIGFTVVEIESEGYATSHFAKADVEHSSAVYDVLNWEEAKILKKEGVKYYNWEQDLGIKGLRASKLKYKPSFFLKQFIVTATTK